MQQNSSGPGPRPKVEPQYVRFVGDSVGVVNLTPNALQILSDHVTQLLMKIITNSKQYTLHGRRAKLHGEDIEAAVKQLKLTLPCSLSSKKSPQFRQFTTPAGEELYVREEYDVEVATVAEEQKPKFVVDSYLKSHWLVYDGKLALVPENVRAVKEEEDEDLVANGETSKAAAITSRRETAGGFQGASVSFRQSSRNVQTKEHIQIKAPIVESLSVEQQLYIKEIVEAVVGTDEQRRIAALYSLESDTGLQPILPKLSRLVSHAVRFNILAQSMPLVIYLIRIYKSFSLNTSLKLENVLHEMIPTMLSCILCANLCRPENENHWALRDFAGKTLCAVVNKHGNGEVRERALRVIKQAWEDPDSTIPVKFGCIFPLLEFLSYDDPFNSKFLNDVKSLHQLCFSMQNNPDLQQVDRSTGTRVTNQLLKAEIAQKLRERKEKVLTKLELLERRSEDGDFVAEIR